MAYITVDELETLDALQAEVRYAYGEYVIDRIDNSDAVTTYITDPAIEMTDTERRHALENLLDGIADFLNSNLPIEEGEV